MRDRDAIGAFLVDLSAPLAADLHLLSAAVRDSGGDLETRLQALVADLSGAVTSYFGLTMTIGVDGHEISFTLTEHHSKAATSLCIPLSAVTAGDSSGVLVLYADVPGAFVDLAADLAWVLKLDPAALVLDQHLVVPTSSGGLVGLREHATINRAIGALLERGHTPESARAEVHRHADLDSGDVPAAAQRILDGVRRKPMPEHG